MRVPERGAVTIKQPEVEPKDDLGVAIALHLIGSADRLEALPLDVLGHEHAPSAEVGPHARDGDERVAAVEAFDATLLLPGIAVLAVRAGQRGWPWQDRWLFAACYIVGLTWAMGGFVGITLLPIVVVAVPLSAAALSAEAASAVSADFFALLFFVVLAVLLSAATVSVASADF